MAGYAILVPWPGRGVADDTRLHPTVRRWPPTKLIVIDVQAKLETALLETLRARLASTFWQSVQVNADFPMRFDNVEMLGDKRYMMMDLMREYSRLRVPTPTTHYLLLVDGETFSPSKDRNFSLSQNDPRGSFGVISVEVLRLPPFVTPEFAQRRITERLYKSIKKRLITMFGYQPAVPDCLMRFFRSVAFIDELPDDVCARDRQVLEAEGVLRPKSP